MCFLNFTLISISKWDTSNVVNMDNMFKRAYGFNGDITKWNTGKVVSADVWGSPLENQAHVGSRYLAKPCTNEADARAACVADLNCKGVALKFADGGTGSGVTGNYYTFTSGIGPYTNWRTWLYDRAWMTSIFGECHSLESKNRFAGRALLPDPFPLESNGRETGLRKILDDYIEGGVLKETVVAQYGHIEDWDMSGVTSLFNLFIGIANSDYGSTNGRTTHDKLKLFTADLSKWNVERVTTLEAAFHTTEKFNSDLSKWNVAKVTGMRRTFYRALAFNSDLSKWDVTNVLPGDCSGCSVGMDDMFHSTKSFRLKLLIDVPWETKNSAVYPGASMYDGSCSSNVAQCRGPVPCVNCGVCGRKNIFWNQATMSIVEASVSCSLGFASGKDASSVCSACLDEDIECCARRTCGDSDGNNLAFECADGYAAHSNPNDVLCDSLPCLATQSCTGSEMACLASQCCTVESCTTTNVVNSDHASGTADITGTTGETVTVNCLADFHIEGSTAEMQLVTCGVNNQFNTIACVADATCNDINADGTTDDSFSCTSGTHHLKTTPGNEQCGANGCDEIECCNVNPTCDNIDANNVDFSSCPGQATPKSDLTGTCLTDTCTAQECCVFPTCDDIDGNGVDFSSCSGSSVLKSDLTGTCQSGTCFASDCCDLLTCTGFSTCVTVTHHLKDSLESITCAADICTTTECCNANPTCGDIDGSNTEFSSCVDGTNHLKDSLDSVTCATETCVVNDCCESNPTCGDIDGASTAFSSCVDGTNHLKDSLTETCATGTCATSDCCVPNAKCNSVLSTVTTFCTSGELVSNAASVTCGGVACTKSKDSEKCCTPVTTTTTTTTAAVATPEVETNALSSSSKISSNAPSSAAATGSTPSSNPAAVMDYGDMLVYVWFGSVGLCLICVIFGCCCKKKTKKTKDIDATKILPLPEVQASIALPTTAPSTAPPSTAPPTTLTATTTIITTTTTTTTVTDRTPEKIVKRYATKATKNEILM